MFFLNFLCFWYKQSNGCWCMPLYNQTALLKVWEIELLSSRIWETTRRTKGSTQSDRKLGNHQWQLNSSIITALWLYHTLDTDGDNFSAVSRFLNGCQCFQCWVPSQILVLFNAQHLRHYFTQDAVLWNLILYISQIKGFNKVTAVSMVYDYFKICCVWMKWLLDPFC